MLPLYTIWFDNFEGKLDCIYAHTTSTTRNIVWELHKGGYKNIEVWLTNSMTNVTKDFRDLI